MSLYTGPQGLRDLTAMPHFITSLIFRFSPLHSLCSPTLASSFLKHAIHKCFLLGALQPAGPSSWNILSLGSCMAHSLTSSEFTHKEPSMINFFGIATPSTLLISLSCFNFPSSTNGLSNIILHVEVPGGQGFCLFCFSLYP